jgi:hypothetical protein
MSTPEGKVKAKIKRELKELACLYDFWPVPTGYGKRTLDILLCAGGWFIAIEAKKKDGQLTDMQEITAAEIRAAHGLVFLVNNDKSLALAMETIKACCNLAKEIR